MDEWYRRGREEITGDVGGNGLRTDIILKEASNVLIIFVPFLEPEVKLSSCEGVEACELQWEVGRNGRRGGQGQEGGDVRSDLESDFEPEGGLHGDSGWLYGRRVGGGSTETSREKFNGVSRGGVWGVDGDGGKVRRRRGNGGAEGGDGYSLRHEGTSSSSLLTSRRRREESIDNRTELWAFKHRETPVGKTHSLPMLLSDEAENRGVNATVLANRHVSELLCERYNCSERFRKRGTSQEGLSSSVKEHKLVNLGKACEEEGQTRVCGGRNEFDRDKRIGREGSIQGKFDGGQVYPETVDLHEIVGRRHRNVVATGNKIRTKGERL